MNLRLMANLLTLSRMALAPVFVIAVAASETSSLALQASRYIFLWVAASDILDGNLARHSGTKDNLGGFLDALADRLFIGVGYLIMHQTYGIPHHWLFLIVASRIVGLGTLWFLIFFASGLQFRAFVAMRNIINIPNPMGKTTVDLQLILMGIVLFNTMAYFIAPLEFIAAALSIASTFVYVSGALRTASRYDPQAAGREERQVFETILACRGRLRRAIFLRPS